MTTPLVGWVSIEFMYAREQAPAGALGLSTRTNRAPTFEPARRSKGLGTTYLATGVTFHGVASSPRVATPLSNDRRVPRPGADRPHLFAPPGFGPKFIF